MTAPIDLKLPKPLVFIGMMGAGKTAIGRRVAARLDIPFIDADSEIEAAAGCSISDIFEVHGETAFRNGERRVIGRLLDGPIQVLATGGGAFIDRETRKVIEKLGISVWLRADFETLWRRVSRRDHRPLLKTENPRETLSALIDQRYPVYAGANITVDSSDGPRDEMVERVIEAVVGYLPASEET